MKKLPFQLDLSGKTAVITGGGGVLCTEFAQVIAATHANVALLDINLEAAERVARKIREDGGNAIAVQCDVLDKQSIKEAHQKVFKKFEKCNILLNGAGGNNPKATTTNEHFAKEQLGKEQTFFDLEKDGFEFVFNLNFMGTLLPTQEFSPDMMDGKDNTIINISSMNAFRPLTKIPAYSAAKAGISNFTQWLAVYFSDVGIRVNALAPGFFSTGQTKVLFYNPDGTPTPRFKKILAHTPMGRLGTPEDLDGTLLWLLNSEASAFVTGVVVPIDGGFAAYSGV